MPATSKRPFGVAGAILVLLLSLGTLAVLLPWLECPSCDGRTVWGADSPRASHVWVCPVCRDHARVSPFRQFRGNSTHPLLEVFARTRNGKTGDLSFPPAFLNLYSPSSMNADREFRPGGIGFPRLQHAFFESDAGPRCIVVFSGSRGQFGMRHPKPWHARLYLFDAAARVVDRWEVDEADENQCADFDFVDEEGAVGVIAMFPRAGENLPADLQLVLRREGKEEPLPGTSVRIELRKGRLAIPSDKR